MNWQPYRLLAAKDTSRALMQWHTDKLDTLPDSSGPNPPR